jgi:MFS family permease
MEDCKGLYLSLKADIGMEQAVDKASLKAQRLAAREAKEKARWEKEKARKKPKVYFWYLLLILTLIYIVDEAVTNSPSSLQTYIIKAFPTEGYTGLKILSIISIVLMIPSCFYKPLADRYGRRLFLLINTFGMAVSMTICFLGQNFFIYALGFVLMRWFVTPDEQVVYIYETSPAKWRGTVNSVIKSIAEFGLTLLPLFRKTVIEQLGWSYRYVFLFLAGLGFIISLLVLFFARETDTFIDSRLAYLNLSPEEKAAIADKKLKNLQNSKRQGGLLTGLAYAFKNKQLRWLFIATVLYTVARTVTDDFASIMQNSLGTAEWAGLPFFTEEMGTQAQFIMPVGAGLITLFYGFISDKIGRKKVSIVLLGTCLGAFIIYVVSCIYSWNNYVIGLFMGLYLGAYWCNGDSYILMVGESAPTNLRASIISAQSAFYGMGQGISAGIAAGVMSVLPDNYLWAFCLALAVPCFVGTLLVLFLKVKETKGLDLNTEIGQSAVDAKPAETTGA